MFSFSPTSGVLAGFSGGCGSGEASKEALGLGVSAPKEALGLVGELGSEAGGLEGMFPKEALELVGELRSEAGGLEGMFPKEDLGLGVALGGGGLSGAEALCIEALFGCSDPSLEVRVRRTTSGRDEACSEGIRALPGDGAREQGRTSSWDSPPSTVGEGWAWEGPLKAGRGSSSSEELASASSSISLSFKGSFLISELSSPWAGSDASSSSLAEVESFSLFKESAEGLVGEVRGLETVDVRTGGEMTRERLLLLRKEGHLDSGELKTGSNLNPQINNGTFT